MPAVLISRALASDSCFRNSAKASGVLPTTSMLRDRVESYRHVNLYNLHYDRHVLGPLRFTGHDGSLCRFDVSYSLFQTELEGASRLFSVGKYRVEALVQGNAARLRSVTVIADTGLVPSLLATPI